jgi:hypothetical protein
MALDAGCWLLPVDLRREKALALRPGLFSLRRRRSRLSLLIAPATCIPSDDARAQDQRLSGRVGSARHAAGSGVACAPTLRREARRL